MVGKSPRKQLGGSVRRRFLPGHLLILCLALPAAARAQGSLELDAAPVSRGEQGVAVELRAVIPQVLNVLRVDVAFDASLCAALSNQQLIASREASLPSTLQADGVLCPREPALRLVHFALLGEPPVAIDPGPVVLGTWVFDVRADALPGSYPLVMSVVEASFGTTDHRDSFAVVEGALVIEPPATATPTGTPSVTPSPSPLPPPSHTPASTPTGSPQPTPTITSTASATPTRTATATPAVNATRVAGRPGGWACLPVSLIRNGANIAQTRNQLSVDTSRFAIRSCSPHPRLGAGGLEKQLAVMGLDSDSVQIDVAGNLAPIDDGVLYSCEVTIAAGATQGTWTIPNSATAVDVSGSPLSHVGGQDAQIVVSTCNGDCDGNGTVSIGEVTRCVNAFLGTAPCSPQAAGAACPIADTNIDGTVSLGEVQACLNRFLSNCP